MATSPLLFLLLLLAPSTPSAPPQDSAAPPHTAPCPPKKLALYEVILTTFWTRDLFPKHYPDWRPTAHWSPLIGRSHDASFALFRLGSVAPEGVKAFAESGRTDALDGGQGGAVLDAFGAPAIETGAGRTAAAFFVDGNHSRVSVMVRIVPSPDWFIGLDSFDLCVNGNWMDSVSIEGDPLDAGTDNGFTFTSPNWATQPQGVIYRLTSTYPSHPAGSFFYPNLKQLPTIAIFQFIKVREYELSKEFHHSRDPSKEEEERSGTNTEHEPHHPRHDDLTRRDDASEAEENTLSNNALTPLLGTRNESQRGSTVALPAAAAPDVAADPPLLLAVPRGDKDAIVSSIVDQYRRGRRPDGGRHPVGGGGGRRRGQQAGGGGSPTEGRRGAGRATRKRKSRPPRNCHVTEWGPWSACSKSCGIGEMQRARHVVRHARGGGAVCPPLLETKWCGSAQPCSETYFQW